jgi:hypothetical protein
VTPQYAQGLHEAAQRTDPGHDLVSCWCCCPDCCFAEDENGDIRRDPSQRD